jgi:hypothetical protein
MSGDTKEKRVRSLGREVVQYLISGLTGDTRCVLYLH